jgi:hypothetical protein
VLPEEYFYTDAPPHLEPAQLRAIEYMLLSPLRTTHQMDFFLDVMRPSGPIAPFRPSSCRCFNPVGYRNMYQSLLHFILIPFRLQDVQLKFPSCLQNINELTQPKLDLCPKPAHRRVALYLRGSSYSPAKIGPEIAGVGFRPSQHWELDRILSCMAKKWSAYCIFPSVIFSPYLLLD